MAPPNLRNARLVFLGLLLIFNVSANAQQHIPYQRLRHHTYRWQAFHTPQFHIYFPEGHNSACAYLAAQMPAATALVRRRMATGLQQSPQIILYPSADQLYESNIGSTELNEATLPTFVTKGARLLVAYNGSYADLGGQLREALVRATWASQLSEGLEAQATGRTHDAVPYWMKEGMIRYFAHGWPVAAEDELLQALEKDHPAGWDAVVGHYPALAGQAMCHYLATQYYPEAPMQLYFLLRRRKPLPRALRLLTKSEADSVYAGCLDFYRRRLPARAPGDTSAVLSSLRLPVQEDRLLSVQADDEGTSIAFVTAGWHYRTVYIHDTRTHRTAQVIRCQLPPWIGDHQGDPYPLLAWTPQKELLIALPGKGRMTIRRYDRTGHLRDRYPMAGIDGIGTLRSTDNGSEVLLAAWRKAQSDIVRYQLYKDRYTPLTYDRYDDAAPAISHDGSQVLFASVRPLTGDKKDTVLQQGIFLWQNKEVRALLTDTTDYIRRTTPQLLNGSQALIYTTENGRRQLQLIHAAGGPGNTVIALLGTDGPAEYLPATDRILSWTQSGDSLFIRTMPLQQWINTYRQDSTATPSPWLTDHRNAAAARAKEDSILKAAAGPEPSFLDGMFSRGKARSAARQDSIRRSLLYSPQKRSPYILQLYSAYFTARVNNDYFFNRYQPWLSYQGLFKAPATGGMAQGGFSDLFENHHFTIAYRLPAGQEGSDFFVRYRNTVRRIGWGLAYYRKAEELRPDPQRRWVDEDGRSYPGLAKVKTNYYELSLDHPLDYYSSVGLTLGLRQDKTIFLATEKYSLDFPSIKSLWSMLTLSWHMDRRRPTLPLLYRGFEGRANIDVFKGFTQRQDALAGLSLEAAWHQPLYRYITLAVQAKGGYSAGDHRILYNLGGVANSLNPRIDSTVHFPQEAPYAFQTLVTPLRGYNQNSLYGSSYALLNADVYFPLFQSLVPVETPLSFINNLQPGIFADLAAAGGNKAYATAAKGWQSAFGLSARTTLAGYPLRLDVGWPGSFSKQPVWSLSLSVR